MCESNKEMSPCSKQSKNYLEKNEKVTEIKIFRFILKLTNWKKIDKHDYAMFFVSTIVWILLAWIAAFIPTVILLLYHHPSSGFLILLYYMKIYFTSETLDEGSKLSNEEKYPLIFKPIKTAIDYFPIRLIKTADLPADKNYILGCYPHGIMPLHPVPNFSTNFNNRDKLFPGISMKVACHYILLNIPIVREYFLCVVNSCSCSASALKSILNSKPSKAVVLYPGGMSEICLSGESDTYKIITSRRKGFIRIALQTGASLVPVFTFGEINVYKTFPLRGMKPTFALDFLTLRGRGYFQHHFGGIPRSVPITTVVGKPIDVPKVKNPSSELIDEYHEKFFSALQSLFDEHKSKYDTSHKNVKLMMI